MNTRYFIMGLLVMVASCSSPPQEEGQDSETTSTPFNEPPAWAKDAIWYQIFPERFHNGDPSNDPTLETIQGSYPYEFDEDWKICEWTSDWYANPDQLEASDYYSKNIQARRYGGDLQGIIDKLDYIQGLGINAIYLNPINDSPSLHKFDPRNFRHIDINFGPDPKGDLAIMENEDPVDPNTWQWTSADLLFLELVDAIHQRGMKVIVDYTWNHSGLTFWAWKDILEKGKESQYSDWFEIVSFDNPETEENEFDYAGWAGNKNHPEFKKVDVVNRVHGKPYNGNIHHEVKTHIFNVTKRWLDPNGDGNNDDGIDGYRLDVAEQIGIDFWKEYRQFVRSIHPNALLVGEIWWEKWPDVMMDPRPYVNGDVFDIVMFYMPYQPARRFFAKTDLYEGARALQQGWIEATRDMAPLTVQSMMAMSASHDSPRLLTSFYNKGKYKVKGEPETYKTGKPDPETYDRVKLYLAFQFTMPGAPQIYAGDEMGMWGGDDPDCRKPLWWQDMTFDEESADPFKSQDTSYQVGFNQDLFNYYKKLIEIRKNHPVLRTNNVTFLLAENDLLVYERSSDQKTIVAIFNNSNETINLPDTLTIRGYDLLSDSEFNPTDPIGPLEVKIVAFNQ